MDKWELIQIINRDCYDAEETIQMINELIEDIDKDPKKFIYELSSKLETFAENVGKCPLCGSNIIEIDCDYQNSEYFGQPVQERIPTYGCESSSCGYIKE